MKKNILFIGLCFFFVSCVTNDGRLSESELEKAKLEVLKKGDSHSYYNIILYYDNRDDYESIIPYSVIMAYKYGNRDAYYFLYRTMIRINNKGKFDNDSIKNLNADSKKFALDNLIKSSSLGNIDAKFDLIKYYEEGKYLPKDSEAVKILKSDIEKAVKVKVNE